MKGSTTEITKIGEIRVHDNITLLPNDTVSSEDTIENINIATGVNDIQSDRNNPSLFWWWKCGVVAVWTVCSIGMTLCNSAIAKRNQDWLLTLSVQLITTALFAIFTRQVTIVPNAWLWCLSVPPLFLGMLKSSMAALNFVSVGMLVMVRSAMPIVAFAFEVIVFRERDMCQCRVFMYLCMILAGVIVYECNDLFVNPVGWGLLFINIIVSVLERLLQRYLLVIHPIQTNPTTLVFLNNAVSSIIALIVIATRNIFTDASGLWNVDITGSVMLVLSCIFSTGLCYAGIILQKEITATTFMVLSIVSKIVLIACDIIIQIENVTATASIGIALTLSGGALYSQSMQRLPSSNKQRFHSHGIRLRNTVITNSILWGSIAIFTSLILAPLKTPLKMPLKMDQKCGVDSTNSIVYLKNSAMPLLPGHPAPSNTVIISTLQTADNSIGNNLHNIMNDVLFARAFNMKMEVQHHDHLPIITPQADFWDTMNTTPHNTPVHSFPLCKTFFEENTYEESRIWADATAHIKISKCEKKFRNDAQEMSAVRSFLPMNVSPNVVYGKLLSEMYTEFEIEPEFNESETRIAIHMRHPCSSLEGTERIQSMFSAATEMADAVSANRSCVFLVAADRNIPVDAIQHKYPRCRLETSHLEVHPHEKSIHHSWDEHGPFSFAILSDLQMLGSAHHIIGSFGSTFSLLARELIASRRYAQTHPPLIVECNLDGYCLPPVSLVNDTWHTSLQMWPTARRIVIRK